MRIFYQLNLAILASMVLTAAAMGSDDPYLLESKRYMIRAAEELSITASPANAVELSYKLKKRGLEIAIGDSFPSLSPKQLDAFLDQVIQEERNGLFTIINDDNDSPNFGYSYPSISHCHRLCLSEISKRNVATGNRTTTCDLGSGPGLVSWKMIALGAHVTAVEKQKQTALKIPDHLQKAKPFLNNILMKEVCTTVLGDVTNYEGKYYAQQYDVTWSGDLIHFLEPGEAAEKFVANLYKITNPGGYAFSRVQPPTSPEIIQFILNPENRKKTDHPGYIIVNHKVTGDLVEDGKGGFNVKNAKEELIPVSTDCKGLIPHLAQKGSFNLAPNIEVIHNNGKKITYIPDHFAVMYHDEQSFSALFQKAGFMIEDVFYEYNGERVNATFEPAIGKPGFKLCIKARKPEAI